jgi:predicted  nucleic acid-binding Zn-ribbon protein
VEPLESLLALVEADRWIERVRGQKSHLPEIEELEALEKLMKDFATTLTSLNQELAPLKKELSQTNAEVETLRGRQLDLEHRMSAPSATPKELLALQAEAEHVRAQLENAEAAEIGLFLQCEPLESELEQLSEQAKELVAQRQNLRTSIAELTNTLDEEIEALISTRDPLTSALPQGLLRQYESARAHVGGGVGAAAISHNKCEGCHISLSPLDIDRFKKTPAGEFMPCPECGRLLLP